MNESNFQKNLEEMGGPATPGADFKTNIEMTGRFYKGLGYDRGKSLALRIAIIVFSLFVFIGVGGSLIYFGISGTRESLLSGIFILLLGIILILAGVKVIYNNYR